MSEETLEKKLEESLELIGYGGGVDFIYTTRFSGY